MDLMQHMPYQSANAQYVDNVTTYWTWTSTATWHLLTRTLFIYVLQNKICLRTQYTCKPICIRYTCNRLHVLSHQYKSLEKKYEYLVHYRCFHFLKSKGVVFTILFNLSVQYTQYSPLHFGTKSFIKFWTIL